MSNIEVGLELQYQDIQNALRAARQLDNTLTRIERNHNIQIQVRGLTDANAEMKKLQDGANKVKTTKIGFDTSGISRAKSEMMNLESVARRVESTFSTVGGVISGFGRTLQSVSGVFGGRAVNFAKMIGTAYVTSGVFSSIEGTIQRYDIMRMFPKRMRRLGFDEGQANKAIDKLEQSVIGLPTGLDEIVNSANQLISLTGSLKRGTDLAIATNNAFLAGGADAQQVEYGRRQIRDLVAAGELRTQEWDSLFKSLGAGLGVIATQMGYKGKAGKKISQNTEQLDALQTKLKSLKKEKLVWDIEGGHTDKAMAKKASQIENIEAAVKRLSKGADKDLGQFRQDLKKGEISAEDFTDALIKAAGIDEKGNLGPLAKWTEDIKDTIGAVTQNIQNAMNKLGEAGLNALDAVLTEGTGKGITGNIIDVSNGIKKNLIPALQGWIVENKDDIINFFNRLKNYDWQDLISRIGKGIGKYYDILSKFFTKMSPKLVAFMAVWGGPLGRAIDIFGRGVTKFGKFAGFLVRKLGILGGAKAGKALTGISRVTKLGGSFKDSMKGFALTAGALGEVALLGGVIAELAKVVEIVGNIKISSHFDRNMTAVTGMFVGLGTIVGALTALFGAVTSSGIGAPVAAVAELLTAGYLGLLAEAGGVIYEFANVLEKISSVRLPNRQKVTKMFDLMGALGDELSENGGIGKWWGAFTGKKTLQNINEAMDSVTGVLDSIIKMQDKLSEITSKGRFGVKKGKFDVDALVSTVSDLVTGMQAIDHVINVNSYIIEEWAANKKSKNLAESIGHIADLIGSVSDIQTQLNKVLKPGSFGVSRVGKQKRRGTMDWDDFGIYIRDIVRTMLDITETVNQNSGVLAEWATAGKTSNLAKSIGNIGDLISNIATIQTNLNTVLKPGSYGVKKVGKQKRRGTLDWDDFNDYIQKIVRSMLDITDTIDENSDIIAEWRAGKKVKNLAESIKNIGKLIDSIGTIQDSIATMNQLGRFGVNNLGGGRGSVNMNSITTAIEGIITPLITSIEDIDTSKITEDTSSSFEAIGNSMVFIKQAISQLATAQTDIESLVNKDNEFPLGDKLQAIVSSFSIFNDIAGENLTDLGTNMEGIKKAVISVAGIAGALESMSTTVNNLVGDDMTFLIGDKLNTIFSSLQTAFGLVGPQLNGNGGTGSLASVAPQLEMIATQLQAIADAASTASSNLESAQSGVEKLGKAASDHKGAISNLATAVGNLKSNSGGIGGKATIAAAGISILGFAAKNQVGNLTAAASAAGALATAIERIPSNKTVNVSVTGNGATYQPGTTADFRKYASGGSVHGPSGIDNVKAWLTNGEFVMTRRAHNAFGTNFMNKVNSLDVDGALRALSIRAGSRVRSGYHVTNNYTRDNHATATFNINRASQGYSQRFASRWVRSLV